MARQSLLFAVDISGKKTHFASDVYGLVELIRNRKPQHLGWMLMYLVVLLFNPNWILASIGILGAASVYGLTKQEEQLLIARFGETYRHYMQGVPRFNLPAGIIRQIEDRGRG